MLHHVPKCNLVLEWNARRQIESKKTTTTTTGESIVLWFVGASISKTYTTLFLGGKNFQLNKIVQNELGNDSYGC